MSRKTKLIFVAVALVILALAFGACTQQSADATSEPQVCPTTAACPEATPPPTPEPSPVSVIPFLDAWMNSPHNDKTAEAFNHWNEDDPAEVPTSCARCHSTPGYMDFVGADGTEAGVVDNAAPVGTTIECQACHNDATLTLTSVTFPSGAVITDTNASVRCMVCHQGRESMVSVNDAITAAGVDADTPTDQLGFINVHYFAAAATRYGSQAHGGYEYDGQTYPMLFNHVDGYQECTDCHDQHTLEIRITECQACHDVQTVDDFKDVRMNGSLEDYDGDGNNTEGIYYELQGLQDMLYQAIQAYGTEVAGMAIVYDENTYPYFFGDDNGNGTVDEGEGKYVNFTPRLLEAAYNMQFVVKDPGAFAHNAKYDIALMYDSIASLNTQLSSPIDLSTAHRDDAGHFNGASEVFRHWDEEGEVQAPCSKCHSADGLPLFVEQGAIIAQPLSNGLACSTCHSSLGSDWPRYEAGPVTFPSGATVEFADNPDANLCLNCHQGRESTVSVNATINSAIQNAEGNVTDDTVLDGLRFRNVHYFAAGATLFGSEVHGAYEYDGQTYAGQNTHVGAYDSCVECHDVHELSVKTDECTVCHNSDDPTTFRMEDTPVDYDGDGDTTEGIYGEASTMADALYAAIQDYAANTVGTPIVYDTGSYPYFFSDDNGNGTVDGDEGSYATWTPNLLRAAYNLQYYYKDPGAFAHNPTYILQILYDSIKGVGGDVSGMTRAQ